MKESSIRAWCVVLLAAPITLLVSACNGPPPPSVVKQMITGAASEESRLAEADTWTTVPRVFAIIKTTGESTLHAQFVAEAVGRVSHQPTQIISVDPESGMQFETVFDLFGTPVEVRILVNEEVMFPRSAQFVGNGTALATHSFLAVAEDVEPRTYSVTVEWRSSRAGAFMRNRTLTVWETERTEPSAEEGEVLVVKGLEQASSESDD